jgi:hypothetical protein
MDSLPTGSTQSWLIVAAVAFSPVIVLRLADAIGWLIRQARGKEGVTPSVKTQAGSANEQCSDWGGGDGHWYVRPIEPSRGVPDRHRGGGSSATVMRQRARPAEHREKGSGLTGARRFAGLILTGRWLRPGGDNGVRAEAQQFCKILLKPHLKNRHWDVLMTPEVTGIGQEPQTVEASPTETEDNGSGI